MEDKPVFNVRSYGPHTMMERTKTITVGRSGYGDSYWTEQQDRPEYFCTCGELLFPASDLSIDRKVLPLSFLEHVVGSWYED